MSKEAASNGIEFVPGKLIARCERQTWTNAYGERLDYMPCGCPGVVCAGSAQRGGDLYGPPSRQEGVLDGVAVLVAVTIGCVALLAVVAWRGRGSAARSMGERAINYGDRR